MFSFKFFDRSNCFCSQIESSRESIREKVRRATEERRKELEEKRKAKKTLSVAQKIQPGFQQDFEEQPPAEQEEATLPTLYQCDQFKNTNERRYSSDWSDWEVDGRLEIVDDSQVSSDTIVSQNIQQDVQLVFPPVAVPVRFAGSSETKEKPLGSEFDVLAVEICTGADETENLFLDMTPVVRKPLTTSVKIPSKFDVASVNEQESAIGWSDNETF